jgi:hypothetical protein
MGIEDKKSKWILMNAWQSIKNVFNGYLPSWGGLVNTTGGAQGRDDLKRNLNYYIAPVQLARLKQDVQTWRDAVAEAENAWYPHRVRMQQCFLDTILNGQVKACMDRRKKMTLQKKHRVVNKKTRKVDEVWTDYFQKKWFSQYQIFKMDADAHGYNLVKLGDMVDGQFPDIDFIRRFNISPDRLNVTEFIYSISGAPFLEKPYSDWHIWLPTPSDVGVSRCGYGYLYEVAFYEIVARNVLTQNLDTTEMYGSPMRVGKTNKSADDPERSVLEQGLANMGNVGYILMDAQGDDIQILESKALGNGYKIYESLEGRVEKKISKIILGHADALDSTPGKIGSGQGGEMSPVQEALQSTCNDDMTSMKDNVNNVLVPKLNNLGLMFPSDILEWEFDNDEEEKETRRSEDKDNMTTSQIYYQIKQAGGQGDWDYFTKRTGIPVKKAPDPVAPQAGGGFDANKPNDQQNNSNQDNQDKPKSNKVDPKVKAKLEKIYGIHKH